MKATILSLFVALCILPELASAQSGGGLSITGSVIAGGGGSCAGGGFTLNSAIGQPEAGATSGGGFSATGGFVPGASGSGPAPRLSVRIGAANTVILSWPNPSTGFVLEQATDINASASGWTSVSQSPVVVGANREVALSAEGARRFFRLRRL